MWFKKMLFTGFYSGYSKFAPGTCGTLVALLLYVALNLIFPTYAVYINVGLILIMLYPAIKLGDAAEEYFQKDDPQQVVLDEMLGFGIAVAFHSFNWVTVLLGFAFFRLFDIWKPFPIDNVQGLKGGLGIMCDDWIAGIYANIVIVLCKFVLFPLIGWSF